MIKQLETLIEETTELVREARAYLKRQPTFDWTLLYGPRGTEIRRPDPPGIVEPDIRWGAKEP